MCLYPRVISYRSRLNKSSDDSAPRVYGARKSVLVTCGKCFECLRRYQNDWTIRNYFQFLETKVAVFFTLTYNENSVPLAGFKPDSEESARSVFKYDVQSFLKRFREYRRRHGLSTDFSYFITSEYGPLTLRPHYHGLLHGITLREFLPFRSAWSDAFGFIQCREINVCDQRNALQSARYVAKYCAKGSFENPLVASGAVSPTFHLISKGLGKSYLTPNVRRYHLALDFLNKFDSFGEYSDEYLEEIRRRSCVVISPCTYALPRYYKEKIFAKSRGLQIALADYISRRYVALYETELADIQAAEPSWTRSQAVLFRHSRSLAIEQTREATARESVAKHLKKSVL